MIKIGDKFGRLTTISMHRENKHIYWLCNCNCGNNKNIRQSHLKSGNTRSCGCLRKEVAKVTNTKHGLSDHKLYIKWSNMLYRCYNEKDKYYKDYGGKGIEVDEDWHEFSKFFEWANNNGWFKELEIDRIDNNKGYKPSNCHFVTKSEQNYNRKSWSETKIKYVYKRANKYRVQKLIDGKDKHIGTFETLEEAKIVANQLEDH